MTASPSPYYNLISAGENQPENLKRRNTRSPRRMVVSHKKPKGLENLYLVLSPYFLARRVYFPVALPTFCVSCLVCGGVAFYLVCGVYLPEAFDTFLFAVAKLRWRCPALFVLFSRHVIGVKPLTIGHVSKPSALPFCSGRPSSHASPRKTWQPHHAVPLLQAHRPTCGFGFTFQDDSFRGVVD